MNTILDYVLYFFFYSCIGWLMETIYCSLGEKKFVNRGFLAGPMCPIYGTGAVVLSACLMPFYEKFGYTWYIMILVILLGMVLADIVEFFTSLIMEKLFNARWWDYSNEFLNLQGRICLKHTLYWGLATGIFIYVVHPFVVKNLDSWITDSQRNQILIMTLIVFAFDLFFAVKGAFNIRKFMTKLNKLHDNVTEKMNEIKTDMQDSVEKQGLKMANWAAEVSRQITELEKPKLPPLRKNGKKRKTRSATQRLYETSKTFKDTAISKLQSIKDIIVEYSDTNEEENTD